jgi:hypothetical protein
LKLKTSRMKHNNSDTCHDNADSASIFIILQKRLKVSVRFAVSCKLIVLRTPLRIRIRIILVTSRIWFLIRVNRRIWIRNNSKFKSCGRLKMEPWMTIDPARSQWRCVGSAGLWFDLGEIRIRIKAKSRIRIRIRISTKSRIWLRIKVIGGFGSVYASK